MTEEIRGNPGTIDKYIGDAIMAFWGAPVDDADHALHAVKSALEPWRCRADGSMPTTHARPPEIGIGHRHKHRPVRRNVGSTSVSSYTVIGDG